MSCLANHHRYRLVGYREEAAEHGEAGLSLTDAVLACIRCGDVKLAGVTREVPVPIVPMLGGVNDVAYWSSRTPGKFDPFDALDTIAKTVEMDDELDRDDADTIQRQVHALRAYITGMER